MTDLTLQEIERIAALLSKATPGEWYSTPRGSYQTGPESGFACDVLIAATAPSKGNRIYADPPCGTFPSADRDLIVALRNAAPALIEMARRVATP